MAFAAGKYSKSPRGAALLLTLLFLSCLLALALFYSLLMQQQAALAEAWHQEDLLRAGEEAALSHALALCNENLEGTGLTGRLFQSAYECAGEKTEYRFAIEDQLKVQRDELSGFPPLTSPRFGQEKNFGLRPAPWDFEALALYAAEILKTAGGQEEQGREYAAALLDQLDVNHGQREENRFGEGLVLTGLKTGDQRVLPFYHGLNLSGFFGTNMVKGAVYQCFTVLERQFFYDSARGGTNTRIRLSENPAGGAMKKHWKNFQPYLKQVSPKGWPKDFFQGEVFFVSSCGGETRKAEALSNDHQDIVLKGRQDIAIGDYFLHSGSNFEEKPGLFCLKGRSQDYLLLTGLCAMTEYKLRYRAPEGKKGSSSLKPDLECLAPCTLLTGGWTRTSSDLQGQLFFSLSNPYAEDLGAFALEFRQSERLYGRNASGRALHLEAAKWRVLTSEGLAREVPLSWSQAPVIGPGEKFEIASDFNLDNIGGLLRGWASPEDLAVPFAIAGAKTVKLKNGYGLKVTCESSLFQKIIPPDYSAIYLQRPDDPEKMLAFPVAEKGLEGEKSITLFLGDEDSAKAWLPKPGGKIYLPCFHCDLNAQKVTLTDQFGQDHSRLFGSGDWLVPEGFHAVKERRLQEEILSALKNDLATNSVILPMLSPPLGFAATKSQFQQISHCGVRMEGCPIAGPNFWQGFNLYTEDGALYRVLSSSDGLLILDRNPQLKKAVNGCLSPGDEAAFLIGPSLEEQVLALQLPPAALLPGDLYLAGHKALLDHHPDYSIALYNFATQTWEPRAQERIFNAGDTIPLGRLTSDYRSPKGQLQIKIQGRHGAPRGYWLRHFFLVPDTQLRQSQSQRCDSYAVTFEIKTSGRQGRQHSRHGLWLLQRHWQKDSLRPQTILACKICAGLDANTLR